MPTLSIWNWDPWRWLVRFIKHSCNDGCICRKAILRLLKRFDVVSAYLSLHTRQEGISFWFSCTLDIAVYNIFRNCSVGKFEGTTTGQLNLSYKNLGNVTVERSKIKLPLLTSKGCLCLMILCLLMWLLSNNVHACTCVCLCLNEYAYV